EHGDDSSVFLVTDSRALAEATIAAIPAYWGKMGEQRVGFSSAVLGGQSGGVVLAPDMEAAIEFVNDYAPEHLLIHGQNAFDHLSGIRNAGEVLLGEHTPLSVANYLLGPNAVLPTGAAATTRSALSVFDYVKLIGLGHMTAKGYAKLAPYAYKFARYEGFDAHANAVSDLRDKAFTSKPGA
ncbi:MAG: histidinol dehydrogenase, partial [Pseudomonadota bacterium]